MADETKKKPAPKKEGKPGTKPEVAADKSTDKPGEKAHSKPVGDAPPAKTPKKAGAPVAEGAAPTLADGGTPVADIAAAYPDADWDAVCGEMFLHP